MISVAGRMTGTNEAPPDSADEPLSGMQAGLQPLDSLMERHGWTNHDLVVRSAEDLTHKVVQKGRKGRRLTRRAQQKILLAVNRAAEGTEYKLEELFNYRGR